MNPADTLKVIIGAFEPIERQTNELTVRNLDKSGSLPLSTGSEVEVEGHVTYVSKVHKGNGIKENDADVHFNLSPTLNNNNGNGQQYLICESY
jgi:hypothetical protein